MRWFGADNSHAFPKCRITGIMKSWIITVTSLAEMRKPPTHGIRVLAIISARKQVKSIRSYLEMFHILSQADLEGQKAITQSNKPARAFQVTESGYCDLHYNHDNHFMVRGQLSDIISIWRDGETSWLRWRGLPYPTAIIDPITHALLPPHEESWPIMEAPKANLDMNSLFG
jgi:hypothetical protein